MIAVLFLLAIAICSYLLGSLNFGVILSRKLKHEDVRDSGSGNAGTTNMLRTYGKAFGILTITGDILKVVVAILIAQYALSQTVSYQILYELFSNSIYEDTFIIILKAYVGIFAVIGHIFPCYFGFKGGKGVATSGGMVIMIDWRIALILLAIFAFTIILTKYVSLGSIIMAILFPVFMGVFYKQLVLVIIACVFTIVVCIAHRENIKRLLKGTENKIGKKKKES